MNPIPPNRRIPRINIAPTTGADITNHSFRHQAVKNGDHRNKPNNQHDSYSRNVKIWLFTSAGCSIETKWLAFGTSFVSAFGISRLTFSVAAMGS